MDRSSVSCDSYSDGYSYRDCQLQNDYCNSNFDTPFVDPNDVGVLIVSTFFIQSQTYWCCPQPYSFPVRLLSLC